MADKDKDKDKDAKERYESWVLVRAQFQAVCDMNAMDSAVTVLRACRKSTTYNRARNSRRSKTTSRSSLSVGVETSETDASGELISHRSRRNS